MSTVCRLLLCEPADGAMNMAIDEALLRSTADSSVPALRFYRWSQPTLSLGYFQQWQDRARHPPSQACAIVRRASGGGAILHDDELTYCLTLPAAHPWAVDPLALYRQLHLALIDALPPQAGHTLGLCENPDKPLTEPFLCFQRRAAGDVVFDGQALPGGRIAGSKLAGSAQRRWRRGVMQHGSVLLGQSRFAPELPGWAELTGTTLSAMELALAWSSVLSARLDASWKREHLTSAESAVAAGLRNAKYAAREWTLRR